LWASLPWCFLLGLGVLKFIWVDPETLIYLGWLPFNQTVLLAFLCNGSFSL
jgi:hypothetical protein